MKKRPNLPSGGLYLPLTEDGPYRPEQPQTSSTCEAVTLRGARESCLSDTKKIIIELRVIWGHAPARQLRRVFVHSGGDNMRVVNYVDASLERRNVCRALEKAPRAF